MTGAVSSAVVLLVSMPIFWWYARLWRGQNESVRHTAIFVTCLLGAYSLRTLYWDILPIRIGDQSDVNLAFNLLFVYGCWHGIKAYNLL